jgi:hypothetical protein
MPLRRAAPLVVVLACVAGSCADDGGDAALTSSTVVGTSTAPGSPSTASPEPLGPCDGLEARSPVPLALTAPLTEISGAVRSGRSPHAVWVHQDSGHEAVLVELGIDGRELSRWVVAGAHNVDWEDIAAAEDPVGARHLFVGDVGDNLRRRSHVEVVRVPEPDASDDSGFTAPAAVLRLELPDGPADVEALIVDAETADVVLITKEISGAARVLVATGAAWEPHEAPVTLAHAGTLTLGPGQAVLGADLGPAGDLIAVRTPFRVLLWPHRPGTPIVETLLGDEPCRGPSVFDPVGEGLALLDDGYVLVGESSAPELVVVG